LSGGSFINLQVSGNLADLLNVLWLRRKERIYARLLSLCVTLFEEIILPKAANWISWLRLVLIAKVRMDRWMIDVYSGWLMFWVLYISAGSGVLPLSNKGFKVVL
jgi:hypothetical protein